MGKNTKNPLRDARRKAGLSQFQVAVKANLHPATISLAERGARVSPETAAKLAGVLGVAERDILR